MVSCIPGPARNADRQRTLPSETTSSFFQLLVAFSPLSSQLHVALKLMEAGKLPAMVKKDTKEHILFRDQFKT